MAVSRILVLILAGGAGSRLELLTEERAKPAVPFGGMYRLIDFSLSNCKYAGIADVWVLQQYQPGVLTDHLANGRPWDLDRTSGGLMVLHPHQGDERGGWHEGTADALWRQGPLIREFDPEALVVVSADAVYKLDYRDVAEAHLRSKALVTMVTTRVPKEDAGRYGVVRVKSGKITDYAYKPDEPASDVVTNEVFVFTPGPVLDLLDSLAESVGDDGLEDLGDHLLPRLVDAGHAREHRFDGYWRDVGTVPAYWEAHMDQLQDEPPLDLDDRAWPIQTQGGRDAAAYLGAGAAVESSLLSAGCEVAGTVHRCVLAPDVRIETGATVRESVLLSGVVVRAGATVERAVLDNKVEIGADAVVGSLDGEITLVGRGITVEPKTTIKPGARFPEPKDD
ncbi:MAG: glucose-1-phosphate adenylyltransferase [Geodermatophilaceae bacterium]|nr:glucose-1-phosphate adenylyltransferase [Geodermatophilaceae bacterium]